MGVVYECYFAVLCINKLRKVTAKKSHRLRTNKEATTNNIAIALHSLAGRLGKCTFHDIGSIYKR